MTGNYAHRNGVVTVEKYETDQELASAIQDTPVEELNAWTPEEMLRWAYTTYSARAGIMTSFQETGSVLIDMASRVAPELRVITIDTLRLPIETYELIQKIETRYGLTIERFEPDPERLRRMIEDHGEYLFFDSKAKQEYCCSIRKVEPNQRALATLDVWITGLRKNQSAGRSTTPKASIIRQDGRMLLRLCPLADWSDEHVWGYLRRFNVPTNALYEKGYTSIGCSICSTPTLDHEDKRAGRWRWFNSLGGAINKECGIHTKGSGI